MTLDIAVITETFHPFNGGSAKRYLEVFSRLAEKGYNVDVYTVRLSDEWDLREEYKGLNIIRSKEALPNYITKDGFRDAYSIFSYIKWLMREFESRKYDIIEANHCPIFPVFIAKYKKNKFQPLVSTIHEVWYDDWYQYVPRLYYAPIGMILEKMMVKAPDHIISVSNFTTNRLVKLLGVDKDKITTIFNGVDLKLYSSVFSRKYDGKIVYGGRLNPHKRIDLLLKSFQILHKRYDVSLDIFGDGPMRDYILRFISRNGFSRSVFLHGRVDETSFVRLMKSGYVYVLPSIREGQSITTLEAMAAGTPQVTVYARNNAAYELVLEADSGLVANLDAGDIASKIEFLLNNDLVWRDKRVNGFKFVSNYDWNIISERHRNLYESLSRR